jgi:hypothetical protein
MNPDKTHEFRLGSISAPDELAELWAIDKTAYGEASSRLVARLPSGIDGSELESRHRWRNRLVASFRPFCGTPHKCPNEGGRCDGPHDAPFRKTPARKWYISGMVRRPEFIGTCAIRVLVGDGLCHWFNTGAIADPCQLLALPRQKLKICSPDLVSIAGKRLMPCPTVLRFSSRRDP